MKKIFAAGLVLASTAAVNATQLGTLSVTSKLNEPMKAVLEIKDVPQDSSKVQVGLASQSVYRALGKTYAEDLRNLTISVASTSPYKLRIESSQPVQTQDFPLILVLDDQGAKTAKLYNLHFAERSAAAPASAIKERTEISEAASRIPSASSAQVPSAARQQVQAAAATVPSAAAATVPSARDAVKSAKTEVKSSVAAASDKQAKSAAQKVQTAAAKVEKKVQTATKPVQKTSAAAKTQKAAQKSGAKVSSASARTASSVRIPLKGKRATVAVQKGTTLWSALKPYRAQYPGASMQQIIVQTIRNNPKCFEGGKSSGVVFGCRMRLPKVITATAEEGAFFVNEHADRDATRTIARSEQPAKPAAAPVAPAPMNKTAQEEPKAAKDSPKTAEDLPRTAEVSPKAADQSAPAEPSQKDAADGAREKIDAGVQPVAEQKPVEVKKAEQTQTAPDAGGKDDAPVPSRDSAEPKVATGWTWILGGILGLIAALGAGFVMGRRRRNRDEAAQDDGTSTVEFRRNDPATREQLEAAAKLFERRMQADEAAARGFPAAAAAGAALGAAAASAPAEQPSEPKLAGNPGQNIEPRPEHRGPVESAFQTDPLEGVNAAEPQPMQIEPAAEPAAPQQPVQVGQDASAEHAAGEPELQAEPEPVQDPFPTAPAGMATIEPEEKLLAKLEKARTYMAVGANGQAQQLLEEVINTSTGEVQRKASEMMALLEKKQ